MGEQAGNVPMLTASCTCYLCSLLGYPVIPEVIPRGCGPPLSDADFGWQPPSPPRPAADWQLPALQEYFKTIFVDPLGSVIPFV